MGIKQLLNNLGYDDITSLTQDNELENLKEKTLTNVNKILVFSRYK